MRVIAHDKSGKVRELKLLKRRYIDCSKYQLYFVQKSYFMCTAVTLIGIMEMYSEGNKTRILIEV